MSDEPRPFRAHEYHRLNVAAKRRLSLAKARRLTLVYCSACSVRVPEEQLAAHQSDPERCSGAGERLAREDEQRDGGLTLRASRAREIVDACAPGCSVYMHDLAEASDLEDLRSRLRARCLRLEQTGPRWFRVRLEQEDSAQVQVRTQRAWVDRRALIALARVRLGEHAAHDLARLLGEL